MQNLNFRVKAGNWCQLRINAMNHTVLVKVTSYSSFLFLILFTCQITFGNKTLSITNKTEQWPNVDRAQATLVGAVVFMLVTLSSNFLFHYDNYHIKKGKKVSHIFGPSNNVPLRQVSFLATPLCSIYAPQLSIIQHYPRLRDGSQRVNKFDRQRDQIKISIT